MTNSFMVEFNDDTCDFLGYTITRTHIFLDSFLYRVDGNYFEMLEDALGYCMGELL